MADDASLEEEVGNGVLNLYLANGHLSDYGNLSEQLEAEHFMGVSFYALRRACNKSKGETNHELCITADQARKIYDTLRQRWAQGGKFTSDEMREIISSLNSMASTLDQIYSDIIYEIKQKVGS